MNLLILTPQLPFPAHQGTSLRNFHIIRGLADDNRITLLSYVDSDDGQGPPRQLADLCEQIVTVPAPTRSINRRLWQLISSRQPDMALRLHSAEFSAALETLLRKQNIDIVQIEGIELAWTIPTIRNTIPDLPVVYDAHNAEALLQSRSGVADRGKVQRWPAAAYSQLQSSRLASYETWVCNIVDRVLAVSEADGAALQGLAGDKIKPITVIPNSIDVAAYYSTAEKTVDRQYQFDIVFSGKMDYRPNVDAVLWFAENVWPLIKREIPDVTWAIVGQRPHARLARLEQMPDVTITGWVQETKPYLFGAKVFVMPFRVGSGTRLKLIEAFAAGRAVVSTRVGVEGFAVEDGRHLLLSDSAEGFANKTVALLADSEQRDFLGDQGLPFAKKYDWRVVVPRIQSVYDEIMAQKSFRNGAGTHAFEQ